MTQEQTPHLTKAELAALDFLIAEAKERNDPSALLTASWAALAREAVRFVAREAARQAVREAVRAVVGRSALVSLGELSDDQIKQALNELTTEEVSLKRLIAIRNKLGEAE